MNQIIIFCTLLISCSLVNHHSSNEGISNIETQYADTIKKYNSKDILESASVFDKDSNLIAKIEYYESGLTKSNTPYKQGLIDGVYRSFFQNGEPECYIEFKAGEKHGHYICNTPDFYLYSYIQNNEDLVMCKYNSSGKIGYYGICKNSKCRESHPDSIPDSLSFTYVKQFLYNK